MSKVRGFRERLQAGETLICAEGYCFAFERQGYVKAGPLVPEVVMDHPELVRQMYRDFVRAGSDVVVALTYYANRKKMSLMDREGQLESLNRRALRMAREVADETGTLMCGDISNTGDWFPDNEESQARTRAMFKEQIQWAVEEGADYIIGETFSFFGEALLALQCIQKHGKGLPAVITLSAKWMKTADGKPALFDIGVVDALKRLEAAGADVVGFNCMRGPYTMIPLLEEAVAAGIKIPLAAVPIPYRTTEEEPTLWQLKDPYTGASCYPTNMDCRLCSRDDIGHFTRKINKLGIQYMGLCCGNAPHYTRTMAEALGRHPEASKYSPDVFKNMYAGAHDSKYLPEGFSWTSTKGDSSKEA
ncbi:betaine--homocysteine S-methyltransferase 1-like [Diadema antillarum]|uniref:betaine--homocysteine S-methyltransferase 1-like n=1 Tax=Diadema antillarum TaxID=105358 RepID=UPI003A8B590B